MINNLVMGKNMLQTITDPNFSVVIPGGCNGECGFCFWKESKACGNYIEKLQGTLNNMPQQFYQLSLTGGEPTLSPYLSDVLKSIDTKKWVHTVLTTNGTNLKKFIPELKGKIRYLNISRHHYDDKINEDVFGGKNIPSANFLSGLVTELQSIGIEVTYSAVITEHLDSKKEIKKFIDFANSHNVNQVFFRKQHGTLDPSNAEKAFEHISKTHQNCPVCRNTTQKIYGTNVIWKASLSEPSKALGMIYELVYNQNGVLTADWEQEMPIKSTNLQSSLSMYGCGGGGGMSGCRGGSSNSYEMTAEELAELRRQERLELRKKKIKKVTDNVNKESTEE